jgi:hypothetical protein
LSCDSAHSLGFVCAQHFANASAITLEKLQGAIDGCIGLIVNIETVSAWVFKGKHWLSIVKTGDSFLNMDSKLDSPVAIPDIQRLHEFLLRQMEERRAHVFVVKHKPPSEDESKS